MTQRLLTLVGFEEPNRNDDDQKEEDRENRDQHSVIPAANTLRDF